MKIAERFLKYVSYETASNPYSDTTPSDSNVLKLAEYLVNELKELGLSNAYMDEYGRVYARLSKNSDNTSKLGFIAHMDTSSDASGENVKARIVEKYDGQTIFLNEAKKLTLDPKQFPKLEKVIGDDLIVTDGTTLLGGDDKAGIAIIMNMLEYFINNPQISHGDIAVAFTPDEEIGRGADYFKIAEFDVDYAFTLDGGSVEEICFENFNAFAVNVDINGKSFHPGDSKGKMINAILVANEFETMLPPLMKPQFTQGYEGFNHLHNINGNCEHTLMEYIVRNHDLKKAKEQLKQFETIKNQLNDKYEYEICTLKVQEQYLNMYEIIKDHMDIIDNAKAAMRVNGVEPIDYPMRGGTDGARLTYEGLLCPNLGTGDFNAHGNFEYVSINMMEKLVDILKTMVISAK